MSTENTRRPVRKTFWAFAGLLFATTGCGGNDCPDGRVRQGDRCVVSSEGADAGTDENPDTDGTEQESNGAGNNIDSGAGGTEGGGPDTGADAAPEASPCESAECHENGRCIVDDGEAVCECNTGYEGDGVDTCERNECIALGDAGAPCGINATCEDPTPDQGDIECTCEPGYAHCEATDGDGGTNGSGGTDAGLVDGGMMRGAGCETHLESDPDNCGECGFACAGSLECRQQQCEQVAGELVAETYGACALLDPADDLGARPLRCWGSNLSNRLRDTSLGTDSTSYRPTPAVVPGIDEDPIRDIAMGGNHTCVLEGGADIVHCWGDSRNSKLGKTDPDLPLTEIVDVPITKARALAAGAEHTCALLSDGTVECWGLNAAGQLGQDPAEVTSTAVPQTVPISNVVEISASYGLTCARTDPGQVACWGVPGSHIPQYLSKDGVELSDAVQIDVGTTGFMCARREGGTVVCWGSNAYGQLGNSAIEESASVEDFVTVEALTDVVDVTAGAYHACALDDSGRVWCWGSSNEGELRDTLHADTTNDDPVRTPAQVLDITDAIDIEAGWDFTCARRRTGQVVCWGFNHRGQLGDGTAVTPGPEDAIRNVEGLP